MRRIRAVGPRLVAAAVVLAACGGARQNLAEPGGGGGTPAESGAITALPEQGGASPSATRDPGTALIASERAVWTLEGLLLAEADAALRSPEAAKVLGEAATLRYSDGAEARVRKYLREKRSHEARLKARALVASMNRTSLAMLTAVGEQTGLSAEDVLMDYLTYDALYDLAMMRYGHKRWKQGAYTGESKALADSFFSLVPEAPSARQGIKVIAEDPTGIEISVFGGRVMEKVTHADVREVPGVGKVGVVEWTSNYEQLRGSIRGGEARATYTEELEWDGSGFLLNYAVELDEYLAWNATNPWAVMLYLASADEVADMYAGMAAAGGLQASGTADLGDLDRLPHEGALGQKGSGLSVKVASVRVKPRLGSVGARRGQFLLVTVAITSSLKSELRAPSDWFRLATAKAEFPEQGVARPGLAPAVLPMAPADAKMLGVPFTAIPAGKTTTLVLIFDVPADLKLAALLLGFDELALKVLVK